MTKLDITMVYPTRPLIIHPFVTSSDHSLDKKVLHFTALVIFFQNDRPESDIVRME